ncbi:MAG: class I SAM-dependent methyltransferase [Burkholderiaceae bacterium]|jgi:SAM-dependent methyltransferase|nr:class I SAM-dependent methyltransferase [Burkholderiaceae bacterium]
MPPTTPLSKGLPSAAPTAYASAAKKAHFWNRIAHKYAADPIADIAGYETSLRRTQGLLGPTHEVLEIGCGTGTTALRLAPYAGRLLATDISVNMIAIAREKLAAEPMPHLHFAVADADAAAGAGAAEFGFGTAAYDAVLAFNLLHLVVDLDHALALVVQALRPGGLLISKTPCVAEMNPLITKLALPLMRAIGKAPHVLCFTAPQLQAAMARQGLAIESVEHHASKGKDIRAFIVARKPA